ncbi:CNP1-like family protein [Thauera phenolivorans]|nr:CNP1-like family protein [Thauera phenolivorans]
MLGKHVALHLIRGGLLALACVSAGASAFLGDVEPDWTEDELVLPPAPQASRLIPFEVGGSSPNRHFIDEASLSVGADRVVRYVLVVRTPGGAENVTFEGIRCTTGERRIYAGGRSDGSWTRMKNSAWQPISHNGYNRARAALAVDFFCDGPVPPRDREHALDRLRGAGDHHHDPSRGVLP